MPAEPNSRPWIRLAAVGVVAGLFASLFGVGGGIVMVPLLVILLGFDAKVATATSLAAIIVTATVGTITHAWLDNVDWKYALLIGMPALAGLMAGLWIKDRISSGSLTLGFAAVLVGVAVWLAVEPSPDGLVESLDATRAVTVGGLGIAAGVLAGLFGVGGGILFVPALTLVVGMPQLVAEGTSLLAIIPVSILGSVRQHRAGTVRWRAALVMGAASVVTAIAGAFAADVTPDRTLRLLFALLVLAAAAQLAARALATRRARST